MPDPCCVVDTTTEVINALNNGQNSISFKLTTNVPGQDICISNQNAPLLRVSLVSCLPNRTMGAYIAANGKDESLLGRERSVHYDEVEKEYAWINPLRFNLIVDSKGLSLPVKGSSLTMDFQLTYNSRSYLDTGNGWGWVNNHQLGVVIDSNGDLLFRGGTGTITRFPLIPDSSPPRWDCPPSSVLDAISYSDEDGTWIEIRHKDGSRIQFLGMAGSEYVPVKTLDCQGRYFYYVYDTSGLLTTIRTDYTSRMLRFEYSNDRLIRVVDTTPNPTYFDITYEIRDNCSYYLRCSMKSGRVVGCYQYSVKGELDNLNNQDIYYQPNEPGVIEKAPIFDCTPKCADESKAPEDAQAKKNWSYKDKHPNAPEKCKDCYDSIHREYYCPNGEFKVMVAFNEDPGNGQMSGKLTQCEENLLIANHECVDPEDPDDCCKICEGTDKGLEFQWDRYGLLQQAVAEEKYAKSILTSGLREAVYNANSRQPSEIHIKPDSSSLDDQIITIDYADDECHGILSVTTVNGRQYKLEYDELKRISKFVKPDNTSVRYFYDNDNQLTKIASETCESEYEINFQYNDDGLVTDVLNDDDIYHLVYDDKWRLTNVSGYASLSRTYNQYGDLSSISYNDGTATDYEYDMQGRCNLIRNNNNQNTYIGYRQYTNEISSITDHDNNVTKYLYNSFGNIAKVLYNNSVVEELEFDSTTGKVTKYKDQNGLETIINYGIVYLT